MEENAALRRQALGPRPAESYRGARRNRWRSQGRVISRPWRLFRLHDPQVIYRPFRVRGWDWRKGGRQVRNVARICGGWFG
jgi:hypothetical protein